jgi:hypothetical protein
VIASFLSAAMVDISMPPMMIMLPLPAWPLPPIMILALTADGDQGAP